jgi:hypothetical protein
MIPQWHSRTFRVAYWDKLGRPPRNPRFALALDSWWVEPARVGVVEQVLQEQPARLRIRWEDGHTTVLTPSDGAASIAPRAG